MWFLWSAKLWEVSWDDAEIQWEWNEKQVFNAKIKLKQHLPEGRYTLFEVSSFLIQNTSHN